MDKTISFTNNTNSIVTSNRILYTPSSFARSSLLTLQEIGTLEALKPHTSSRDNLQSYLFFYVESGSGKLVYHGKEYVCVTGCQVPETVNKSYMKIQKNSPRMVLCSYVVRCLTFRP